MLVDKTGELQGPPPSAIFSLSWPTARWGGKQGQALLVLPTPRQGKRHCRAQTQPVIKLP